MYRDYNLLYIVMYSTKPNGQYYPIGVYEKKGHAAAELIRRGMKFSRRRDLFYSNCKKKWFSIISLKRNEIKRKDWNEKIGK